MGTDCFAQEADVRARARADDAQAWVVRVEALLRSCEESTVAAGDAPGRLSRPRSPANGTPAMTEAQFRAKPLHVHAVGGCGPASGAAFGQS